MTLGGGWLISPLTCFCDSNVEISHHGFFSLPLKYHLERISLSASVERMIVVIWY